MVFNVDKYMHGYCQYFAITVAEMFNGKVCLWLDFDEILNKPRLCHAYAKITNCLYADAMGAFSNIKQREDEYEFNYQNIVELTVPEAKKRLRKMGIPYGDTETKREVREFLRNNMLCIQLLSNLCDTKDYYGLYYSEPVKGIVLAYMYNPELKTFARYLHKFSQNFVNTHLCEQKGWVSNPKWYYKK